MRMTGMRFMTSQLLINLACAHRFVAKTPPVGCGQSRGLMSSEGGLKNQRLLTAALSDHASGDPGRASNRVAAAIVLVASLVFLPIAHAVLIFGPDYQSALRQPLAGHIVVNSALTAVIIMSAFQFKGRLDRKIAALLTRTILVHGAMAFIVLVSRAYYSNQVMLTAAFFSVVFGLIVVGMVHKVQTPRVALLGVSTPPVDALQGEYELVPSPTESLRPYDVLLTTGMVDLSPEWAPTLTRAMLAGKTIRHLAEYVEEMRGVVSVDHFDLDHLPAGGLTSYRVRKRLFDIAVVILALPLALPLLMIGALAVQATMGGPVIFVQRRVGLAGRPFTMYKLRTMRDSADNRAGTATSIGDNRVTKTGQILRRFRIDELPQLWNVLKGDMSLIGPRPEQEGLSYAYISSVPSFAYRSLVRPGITGWAQVNAGYAANLEESRIKLSYDLFYVKNISFSLDIQIVLRTVFTILGGAGVR